MSVECHGRPRADLNDDCKIDLEDHALFQQFFTGPQCAQSVRAVIKIGDADSSGGLTTSSGATPLTATGSSARVRLRCCYRHAVLCSLCFVKRRLRPLFVDGSSPVLQRPCSQDQVVHECDWLVLRR